MAARNMKSYSLSEIKDKFIGIKGTQEREKYEYELKMDILGRMIKSARIHRKLTQEELGKLIGVQKAQISKIESGAGNVTIETIVKVISALNAEINFNIRMEETYLELV